MASEHKTMVRAWYAKHKYRGMTHGVPMWALRAWRLVMCRRGIHCFDEVVSSELVHCLYCDACGLSVHIDRIEEEESDD